MSESIVLSIRLCINHITASGMATNKLQKLIKKHNTMILKNALTSPQTCSPIERPRYTRTKRIVALNFDIRMLTRPAWNMYVLKKSKKTTMTANRMLMSWMLKQCIINSNSFRFSPYT